MGITTAPSKILVTGANGFVAMWTINLLLNAGYSVRGVVRKLDKSKDLASKFSDFVETGKLEFAIVEDITAVSIIPRRKAQYSDPLWIGRSF
jgi:nucleoside-diphosphate-sugar epimerase